MHLIQVNTTTGQCNTIRADRDLSKRLFSAATSGRKVNVSMLLTYELASAPLSLASFDGNLCPTKLCYHIFSQIHSYMQNYLQHLLTPAL